MCWCIRQSKVKHSDCNVEQESSELSVVGVDFHILRSSTYYVAKQCMFEQHNY